MNEVVFKTLKGKDFIFKNYLIKVAKELKLTLNETLLLVYFTNQEEPTLNIKNISSNIYLSEEEIMEAFSKLVGINLISVNVIKDSDGRVKEVISFDNLIKQASTDILTKHKSKKKDDLFSTFESEFGRTLSPIEYEIINDWLNQKISEELILEALKEAIYNGAKSLRYINKILLSWQEKGYKVPSDIKKGREKKETEDEEELYEYDWLENE